MQILSVAEIQDVDLQEDFIEPLKIMIEDLRNFTDGDGSISGDREIDTELARRIQMIKSCVLTMQVALNQN